jgi:hypothetical protein
MHRDNYENAEMISPALSGKMLEFILKKMRQNFPTNPGKLGKKMREIACLRRESLHNATSPAL